MADRKLAYAAEAALTVTNLHALAASATWVAGWESAVIDNTSNKYLDYIVSGLFKTAAANNQVGTVFVYVVPMISESVYPDVFDGTESAETISLTNVRDSICKLGAVIAVTASASLSYPFAFTVASLFGGICPPKFVLFVTGNATTTTTAQFAADTNIVTIKGIYEQIA
jgi:hypothetical protein